MRVGIEASANAALCCVPPLMGTTLWDELYGAHGRLLSGRYLVLLSSRQQGWQSLRR